LPLAAVSVSSGIEDQKNPPLETMEGIIKKKRRRRGAPAKGLFKPKFYGYGRRGARLSSPIIAQAIATGSAFSLWGGRLVNFERPEV